MFSRRCLGFNNGSSYAQMYRRLPARKPGVHVHDRTGSLTGIEAEFFQIKIDRQQAGPRLLNRKAPVGRDHAWPKSCFSNGSGNGLAGNAPSKDSMNANSSPSPPFCAMIASPYGLEFRSSYLTIPSGTVAMG
nr:hypothetical protein CFP56_57015 [Quercus suber]